MDIFTARGPVRKALNHHNVFYSQSWTWAKWGRHLSERAISVNPITGNPIGPVVRVQQLVSTLSLRFLFVPPGTIDSRATPSVIVATGLWLPRLEGGTTPGKPILPGWTEPIAQDINAAPCQLQFTVTTVSRILWVPPFLDTIFCVLGCFNFLVLFVFWDVCFIVPFQQRGSWGLHIHAVLLMCYCSSGCHSAHKPQYHYLNSCLLLANECLKASGHWGSGLVPEILQ